MAESADSAGGRRSPGPLRLWQEADRAWRQRGPTRQAVRVFGVRADELRPMPGGAHTWTDGRLFLKPAGCVPEHAWVCEVYANWTATHVRVPEPVMPHGPSETGWSSDGWGAQELIRGRDAEPGELGKIKEAAGLANAIAATDAVTFRDAPLSLLDEWSSGEDWGQLLVRAVLYRLGPTGIFAIRNRLTGILVNHVKRVAPVVDAIASR